EDQVDVEVIALQGEPSLSCDDAEALAELEQERLDPIDDRLLEVALEPGGPFLQIEELEDLRQSLEQEGCDLPLQLSDGPALLGGLDLVEGAGALVLDADEGEVVAPAQGRGKGRRAVGARKAQRCRAF